MSFSPTAFTIALLWTGVVAFAGYWRRGDKARREQRWSAIAQELGWEWNGFRIMAALKGNTVTVREAPDTDGKGVELVAPSHAPSGFSLEVRRRDGSHGVPLGHPFDAAFTLHGSDRALARVWLDAEALRAFRIVALEERRFHAALADGYVTATAHWPNITAPELSKLVTLVAAIADGGRSICVRWAELARHLGSEPHARAHFPPPPIIISRQGCVVRVEISAQGPSSETIIAWTPAQARDQAKAGRKTLAGIVLDRQVVDREVEEAVRVAGGSSDPYR